jgi:hypothetical protein
MRRDLYSGILLIAGALAGVFVMSLHPTARDMIAGAGAARQAHLGVLVHAVALATVPVLFLGLLGLSRRLGPSDLTTAALVFYGFGGVAVISAAVASGFVATPVIRWLVAGQGEGGSPEVYHALLGYTSLWNQGFAKVSTVAVAVAILLWSAAIWRSGPTLPRMPRAAGVFGAIVGAGVLIGVLSGQLRLDVHGFAIVTLAQSAWLLWLGVVMCRQGSGVAP